MQEKTIKKFGGKIIGYISTDAAGNKTVMDYNRRILGYYDARRDDGFLQARYSVR